MFSLFRRKRLITQTQTSADFDSKTLKAPISPLQAEVSQLANMLDATYGKDEDADRQFSLITIGLDENTLLWRQCRYKFEWTVKEIRETIANYGRLDQDLTPVSTNKVKQSVTYESIVKRLKAHQQTMIDLEQATNRESNEVLDIRHPSNEASTQLIGRAFLLQTRLERLIKVGIEKTYLKERVRTVKSQLIETQRYLICRDPKESIRELTHIETEIEEIVALVRK